MKFDPRAGWSYPEPDQPVPCYVVGLGLEPAELDSLRQLGFEVHWVRQAPARANWVVEGRWVQHPYFVSVALGFWRQALGPPMLPECHWQHLGEDGWISQLPARRRLTAWAPWLPEFSHPAPTCLLLLGSDWNLLDQWLEIAQQAQICAVAACDPQAVVDFLPQLHFQAAVASPQADAGCSILWEGRDGPSVALLAGAWDLASPEAFGNLLGHALWRSDVEEQKWAYRQALTPHLSPIPSELSRLLADNLERSSRVGPLRRQFEQLAAQLGQHLLAGLDWHWQSDWDGSWTLRGGPHCYRWRRHDNRLSYQDQLTVLDVRAEFSVDPQTLVLRHSPWDIFETGRACLPFNPSCPRNGSHSWRFCGQPSPSLEPEPVVRCENPVDPERRASLIGSRSTRWPQCFVWGDAPEAQGLLRNCRLEALRGRSAPRQAAWLVCLLPSRQGSQELLDALRGRPELVLAIHNPNQVGRVVCNLQPDWVLCDPTLAPYLDLADAPVPELWGPRMRALYCMDRGDWRRGLLPDNWREVGLTDFLDRLPALGRWEAPAASRSKKMNEILHRLQTDLSQCDGCVVCNQADGGWTLQLRQPDAHYRWSPSTGQLRAEVPKIKMGGYKSTRSTAWPARISRMLTPSYAFASSPRTISSPRPQPGR